MQNPIIVVIFGILGLASNAILSLPAESLLEASRARAFGSTGEVCSAQAHPSNTGHAYHNQAPTAPLPPTLEPNLFSENKAAFVAYSIAGKIRELLYQEPCYCGCDRAVGHESLLDCYTGRHGVTCGKCQIEVFFIYEASKRGLNAAQIRTEMEQGDVWKLKLNEYVNAHYADYQRTAP
jgi:Protein of unknown function with PCYCGC motif